jgi:hypothetical protein
MENASFPPLRDPPFTIAFEMPRNKKNDSSFRPRLTAIRKARGLTVVGSRQGNGGMGDHNGHA